MTIRRFPEPADAAARRRVTETLDRPLLVEAGAGTGKTTLLVDRLIHALAAGAASMPGVVAISFTEKAAAELRQRLRNELERAREDPERPAAARERLARAARELDRATVSTIHAFAASILRERPLPAQIDPQFRTLDELEAAELRREVWNRWVEAELAATGEAAALRPALLAGVRVEPDLWELTTELEAQRDVAELVHLPPLPADLDRRMRALYDDMRACIAHGERECRSESDGGLVKLRQLGMEIDRCSDIDLRSWPAIFLQKLTIDTRAGRREEWRDGAAAASKEWRKRLRAELGTVRQAIADSVLHEALQWIGRFREEYAAEKRRRGVLDFQDLLQKARGLVRDHPQVRAQLGARIDMLCVDEFQDTDPLQAELVLLLTEVNGPAADWRQVVVGPKLFLVGDPKQSIYRFRRADPEIYAACARLVEAAGGSREHIVQNFRSRPAVLHWVNGVFAHLYDPARAGADDPQHVPLVPLPDSGRLPAVCILTAPPGEPAPEEEWRRGEARALAAWVVQALRHGFPVRDGAETRPLRPGDVAILFARTSGIEHYEEELQAAGLPFQQEGGRLFFRRQEVRDVLHALAAIDDPHDELAIVAALRSPLFGVTDEELWLHRAGQESFSYHEPLAAASPLALRLQIMAQLHAERHASGVAGTIARLLDVTEARAAVAARPHGAQALANLEQLQRLARQFEAARGGGLRQFLRGWHALGDEAPRIAEWTPQQDTVERVRLLTVHMAKGLEFPCVLLANLCASGSTQRPAVVVDRLAGAVEVRLRAGDAEAPLTSAGYEAASLREKERAEAEERRLLYVAATRARDYLVVSEHHGKRVGGLLAQLREVPGALDGSEFGELPAAERGPGGDATGAWRLVAPADLPMEVAERRAPARPPVELTSLWRARRDWGRTHARRIERGGGGGVVPPAGLGLGGPSNFAAGWGRERAILARLLELEPSGLGPRGLRERAREVARLLGAPEVEKPIVEWAAQVHPLLGRLTSGTSRRARFGVQITAAVGANSIEAWLDLVLTDDRNASVVEFAPPAATTTDGQPAPADAPAEERLLWKALALTAGGWAVDGLGCFDLERGLYLPVAEFANRINELRGILAAR